MSEPQTQIMYQEEPRSCCCRVTTGLKVVAVCEIIFIVLVLFSTGYRICTGQYMWADFAIIPFLGFGLFASCQLFHAVDSTAPGSVIPYLVYKYISLVLSILGHGLEMGLFVIVASLLKGVLNTEHESLYNVLMGLFVYEVVLVVLGIVFLVIAHKGRTYLRKAVYMAQLSFNKQNYSNNEPTVVPADQARSPPYAFCAKEAV